MESSDIILKGDHLRTVSSKFGPNSAKQFQKKKIFKTFFPIGSYVKTMSVGVGRLAWQDGVNGYNSETVVT